MREAWPPVRPVSRSTAADLRGAGSEARRLATRLPPMTLRAEFPPSRCRPSRAPDARRCCRRQYWPGADEPEWWRIGGWRARLRRRARSSTSVFGESEDSELDTSARGTHGSGRRPGPKPGTAPSRGADGQHGTARAQAAILFPAPLMLSVVAESRPDEGSTQRRLGIHSTENRQVSLVHQPQAHPSGSGVSAAWHKENGTIATRTPKSKAGRGQRGSKRYDR